MKIKRYISILILVLLLSCTDKAGKIDEVSVGKCYKYSFSTEAHSIVTAITINSSQKRKISYIAYSYNWNGRLGKEYNDRDEDDFLGRYEQQSCGFVNDLEEIYKRQLFDEKINYIEERLSNIEEKLKKGNK